MASCFLLDLCRDYQGGLLFPAYPLFVFHLEDNIPQQHSPWLHRAVVLLSSIFLSLKLTHSHKNLPSERTGQGRFQCINPDHRKPSPSLVLSLLPPSLFTLRSSKNSSLSISKCRRTSMEMGLP